VHSFHGCARAGTRPAPCGDAGRMIRSEGAHREGHEGRSGPSRRAPSRRVRPRLLSLLAGVRAAALGAWGVLLPVDCGGCGRPGLALCGDCRRALRAHPIPVPGLPVPTVAALVYEGPVAACLRAYKDAGRLDLAAALAVPLRAAVAAAWEPQRRPGRAPPVLLAVPSAPAARRRRGYAPVSRLIRAAGLAEAPGARLEVVRRVADQAALDRGARGANVAGAMRASGVRGLRVVLVDDVVTTGATVREAVRAVSAAGGSVVAAASLAHAEKRNATTRRTISDNPSAPG
jgi:predicted amidophosphoribosyltransferase